MTPINSELTRQDRGDVVPAIYWLLAMLKMVQALLDLKRSTLFLGWTRCCNAISCVHLQLWISNFVHLLVWMLRRRAVEVRAQCHAFVFTVAQTCFHRYLLHWIKVDLTLCYQINYGFTMVTGEGVLMSLEWNWSSYRLECCWVSGKLPCHLPFLSVIYHIFRHGSLTSTLSEVASLSGGPGNRTALHQSFLGASTSFLRLVADCHQSAWLTTYLFMGGFRMWVCRMP